MTIHKTELLTFTREFAKLWEAPLSKTLNILVYYYSFYVRIKILLKIIQIITAKPRFNEGKKDLQN